MVSYYNTPNLCLPVHLFLCLQTPPTQSGVKQPNTAQKNWKNMWQCVRNERKPHYLMEKKIYCGLNSRQPKNLSENWRGRFAEFGQISAPVYFYACLTMSGHDGDLITEILGSLSWEHWMDGNTVSLRWSIGFKSRERGASQWHQFLRSPGAAWMLCPRRNPGATAPAQGLTMGPRISSRYLTAVHVPNAGSSDIHPS